MSTTKVYKSMQYDNLLEAVNYALEVCGIDPITQEHCDRVYNNDSYRGCWFYRKGEAVCWIEKMEPVNEDAIKYPWLVAVQR